MPPGFPTAQPYLPWAERGKALAALGICAGLLDPAEHFTLSRSVVVIGGRNDPVIPFSLQQQAIDLARQIDNATGPGQSCGPMCKFYPSTSQTPVVTRIHDGGHIYPLWAGAAIVEFFKLHQLWFTAEDAKGAEVVFRSEFSQPCCVAEQIPQARAG
jgi:hypothetical protein